MADGGVVTQEGPKVKWTEDKALTTTDRKFLRRSLWLAHHFFPDLEQQLERLLSVKLTSFPATDPPQHYATLSVEQLLEERDEMWREHGRSLCAFMEREQGRFLRVLHQEIEQLQRKCGGKGNFDASGRQRYPTASFRRHYGTGGSPNDC